MSLSLREVLADAPTKEAFRTEHGERASYYHGQCRNKAVDSAVFAYLAGKELMALKASLDHGAFMPACEKLGIPHSSVQRYVSLAKILDEQGKLPTMGNLKLLANGEVTGEDKEKIAKAFHDAVDSKSLTELYRAVGVIHKPKPHEFHPLKPVDAKAKLAEQEASAREDCRHLLVCLQVASKWLPLVDDALREQVLDACVETSNLIRASKKTSPSAPPKTSPVRIKKPSKG